MPRSRSVPSSAVGRPFARRRTDPDGAVRVLLTLPDRRARLELLDAVACGVEGVAAVRRRRADDHARLSERHDA